MEGGFEQRVQPMALGCGEESRLLMASEKIGPLVRLIGWAGVLTNLVREAQRVDSEDGASVCLERWDVKQVLIRCISAELDVAELPEWAEAVHMSERIEIDDTDVDLLTQFLFEISSPELFEQATVELCQRWMGRLVDG
ncbi:hypothetical protein [Streptomyces sp. TP-A0874]|uniref:hypothetical protein n=1 Tax=Streptomyces sp. TP-A0874 TaxID=549819 RepID=UPI0008535F21|nr:hypothetical protein [Streptomyces sp. TP-A0874]